MPETRAVSAEELGRCLESAACDVLETMFFTEASPAAAAPSPPGDFLAAVVGFQGTCAGAFTAVVAADAARMLAANFLGVDEDGVTAAEAQGVVSELTNMICGAVLSRLRNEGDFALSAPAAIRGELPPRSRGQVWRPLSIDGRLLEIGLDLRT